MADINIKVGLQGAAEVKAQMGYIEAAAKSFGDKLSNKLVSTFSAVAVGAMAFDKLLESINKNIAASKQITKLSAQFHLDPKEVHSMMIAANNAGVAVRSLLQAMKQLTKFADGALMKGGGNRDIMKQLFGYDKNGNVIEDLDAKIQNIAKAPAKFLPEVAMQLALINNEQDKTKVGTQLLGRQYTQLASLLEELASSEEARNNFLENGNAMTDEQVETHKKLAQLTSDLQNSWDKFVASISPLLVLLAAGLQYLGSWVDKIKMIGREWNNSIVQGTAKATEKTHKYEETLRKQVEKGELSDEDKKDFKQVQEGKMTQEEWIQKKILENHQKNLDEENPDDSSMKEFMVALGVYSAAGLATIATGSVGGVAAFAGATYYLSERNEAYKRQKAEKKKSMDEIKKSMGDESNAGDKAFESYKQNEDDMLSDQEENLQKERQKEIDQLNEQLKNMDEKDRGSWKEQEMSNINSRFQKKLAPIAQQKMALGALKYSDVFGTRDVTGAYRDVTKKNAQVSADELAKEYKKLNYSDKQIWAMVRSQFGENVWVDKEGNYHTGEKPNEEKVKTIDIKETEVERKKREEKERQMALRRKREGRALETATIYAGTSMQEEEALAVAQNKLAYAGEDIATSQPKLAEAKTDLDAKTKAYEIAKAEAERQKTISATLAEEEKTGSRMTAEEQVVFSKKVHAQNEALNLAKTAETTAKTAMQSATTAHDKLSTEVNKALVDQQSAIKEIAKAEENLFLKKIHLQNEARKSEEDLENRMFALKYRNMQKLGYNQQQILEEQFMDSVANYNRQESDYKSLESKILQRMKDGKRGMTESERVELKTAAEGKAKAFDKVQENLNKWEDYKGERVVSDLGRVGGGSAFQMAGSGPTSLLKEQVKLQTAIAYNTDPKHLEKLQQARTMRLQTAWGDKSVWGKKQKLIR